MMVAFPDHSMRSTETSSTVMSAMCLSLLLSQLLVRCFDVVQATQTVEGLLWVVVEFAVANALESVDGICQRHVRAWQAGELLCDEEVLAQEALNATCALNGDLVIFGQLVHTQNRDNILQFLVRSEEHTSELQSRFDLVCRPLLAN